MIRSFLLTACLFVVFPVYGKEKKISLSEALKLVLETKNEFETIEKHLSLIDLKAKVLNKAYDTKFSSTNYYNYDKSSTNRIPSVKNTQTFNSNFEITKMFSSGTRIKSAMNFIYQDSPLDQDLPEDSPLTSFFSGYKPTTFESKIEFEISQALLKNWMTKEVELHKKIIKEEKITPTFQGKILAQNLQYEMEILFIRYSHIIGQIELLESMKDILKKMVVLIKKQLKIGRADDLNVIKSEYRVISLDVRIENLRIEKEQLARTIFLKCGIFSYDNHMIKPLSYKKRKNSVVFSDYQGALDFALANRVDLKEVEALEEPVYTEIKLNKEQNRPSLDIFLKYSANGREKNVGESLKTMLVQDHPKISIGFTFSVNLGSNTYRDEYRSRMLSLDILDSRKKDIVDTLKQDLKLAFFKIKMTEKKLKLNDKRLVSLKEQLKLEKVKFSQARAEELSLLVYDIDMKELAAENLAVLQEEQLALAHIRFLTHSYLN